MADRKAELERKKAKLQAMREEKLQRERQRQIKVQDSPSSKASGDQCSVIDETLAQLGIPSVTDVLSSLSSISSNATPDQSAMSTPDTSLQITPPSSTTQIASGKKSHTSRANLITSGMQSTDIAPKEIVTYSKQTQTVSSGPERDGYFEEWWRPRKAHAFDYYDEYNLNPALEWDDEFTAEDEDSSLPPMDGTYHSKLPPGILPHGMPQVKDVQPAVTAIEEEAAKQHEVRELSEEEKTTIMLSEDFQRFFNKTTRIMERSLCENVDVCAIYDIPPEEESGDDRFGTKLSMNRCFSDDRWSRNRCVTSMDWSAQYPELLLVSYNNNEDTPHDPDGVCLIWNTKYKKDTPEYIFHCQSQVMSATFARFHPNLILGGTYSGQIVLWDNRVLKRTPVQRSPLSAAAHTHPVYCMKVVGTQNAHNLISISTDGKVCSWSLDMLSQPQETLELQHKQSKAVAVTSLSFPQGDVNNFIVGSEEGTVYTACRHGNRVGVTDVYEGHQGPVTGLDSNCVPGPIDFSHHFLTSSIDWTVKLWSLKENKPLYTFEGNGDYVYDVAWSPIHPALFATVDGMGKLDLWNLNVDTEVPTASVVVDPCLALNRVSWTQSGLHVTVGDDSGKIWVYDVGEILALPRPDEWNKFFGTLEELRNNQEDDCAEKIVNPSSSSASLSSFTSSPLR